MRLYMSLVLSVTAPDAKKFYYFSNEASLYMYLLILLFLWSSQFLRLLPFPFHQIRHMSGISNVRPSDPWVFQDARFLH